LLQAQDQVQLKLLLSLITLTGLIPVLQDFLMPTELVEISLIIFLIQLAVLLL
jgi:hypothetical protein